MKPTALAVAMSAVTLSGLLAGCARHGPPETPPGAPPPGQALLVTGRRLAQQGQSLRAEQYLLAALASGAPSGEAFTLLVETCIESGRYRSALYHVESRLLDEPESRSLSELAGTLRETLGLERGGQQ